jgi:hypothetical protein
MIRPSLIYSSAVVALAGCTPNNYVPVELRTIREQPSAYIGKDVRVHVNPTGTINIGNYSRVGIFFGEGNVSDGVAFVNTLFDAGQKKRLIALVEAQQNTKSDITIDGRVEQMAKEFTITSELGTLKIPLNGPEINVYRVIINKDTLTF